jgi:hypothetical protein
MLLGCDLYKYTLCISGNSYEQQVECFLCCLIILFLDILLPPV